MALGHSSRCGRAWEQAPKHVEVGAAWVAGRGEGGLRCRTEEVSAVLVEMWTRTVPLRRALGEQGDCRETLGVLEVDLCPQEQNGGRRGSIGRAFGENVLLGTGTEAVVAKSSPEPCPRVLWTVDLVRGVLGCFGRKFLSSVSVAWTSFF